MTDEMLDDRARSAKCDARAVDARCGAGRAWMWAPQAGGHGGHCEIEFDIGDAREGCFDASYFHDGEFPSDSCVTLHHCSAMQFVRFGIDVYDAMLQSNAPDEEAKAALENLRLAYEAVERLGTRETMAK